MKVEPADEKLIRYT